MDKLQTIPLTYKICGAADGNRYEINGYLGTQLVMVYNGFVDKRNDDILNLYPKRRLSYNPRLPIKHKINVSRDVKGWEK